MLNLTARAQLPSDRYSKQLLHPITSERKTGSKESKDLVENYQQSGGIAGEDLGSSGECEARDTDMGEGTRGPNLGRDEDEEAVDDVEEEFHHEELEGGGSVDVGKEHEDLGSRKCLSSNNILILKPLSIQIIACDFSEFKLTLFCPRE